MVVFAIGPAIILIMKGIAVLYGWYMVNHITWESLLDGDLNPFDSDDDDEGGGWTPTVTVGAGLGLAVGAVILLVALRGRK